MVPQRMFLAAVLIPPIRCSSQTVQPLPVSKEQKLTPEDAKEALLEMMRSKPGKDVGWFNGNVPEEMGKMKTKKLEDGWYGWTGAFRFHPAKAVYIFVAQPQPGVRACIFEYKGTFACEGGRWSPTPPELVQTTMQARE